MKLFIQHLEKKNQELGEYLRNFRKSISGKSDCQICEGKGVVPIGTSNDDYELQSCGNCQKENI